jgi:serine O-acetyltransferase
MIHMILSLQTTELKNYISKQLEDYFPDKYKLCGQDIDNAYTLALERLENCFKYISVPAYSNNKGETYFSHLHSDQYAQFLYFFSNSLWTISENKPICDKLIFLNRVLNNMFISYKCKMPDIFFLGHSIGSIIGNASYSNFLVVFQNVTINTSIDIAGEPAPKLGKGLFLGAGAKIIGNQSIGDRVSIGVDAVVYNQKISNDSVVLRNSMGCIEINPRKKTKCMAQNYFNIDIN